ncbi:hypothetical protein AGR2A_pc0145 [Agrobacterium genomosp. 2 str. CFBP 5494]|uniref:Uncharacterized protein n=1 Tax=Agrobacterium genomosp. 2 str. CFBP 5494 TaxID=1183436 RepID=A0A9W5F8R0_9HYPH|nr:hypothetical protein AGR2A_pc0145 [Agrobacterium genomosp. 2 str. CFBP 5494]
MRAIGRRDCLFIHSIAPGLLSKNAGQPALDGAGEGVLFLLVRNTFAENTDLPASLCFSDDGIGGDLTSGVYFQICQRGSMPSRSIIRRCDTV